MNDTSDPDADSDGDGQPDNVEMANGFDPNDDASYEADAAGDSLPDFADVDDEEAFAWVPARQRAVAAVPCHSGSNANTWN